MSINDVHVKVGTVAQMIDVLSTLPPEAEVYLDNEDRLVNISFDWTEETVQIGEVIHPKSYPYHIWQEYKDNG